MVSTSQAVFRCTGCGKCYHWRPDLAGRPARCPCGTVLNVPAKAPHPDDDLYPLVDEPQPAHPPRSSRQALTALRPLASVSQPPLITPPTPVLPYQNKATAAQTIDPYFPDRLKDLHFPLILLIGGVVVQFLAGWWDASGTRAGAMHALRSLGTDMVLSTLLMLLAVFIAARQREIRFGPFWGAVLKLSAAAVAPSAAMILLNIFLRFLPFGFLPIWLAGFCLYFALLGLFFDLDQSDTWYCVVVIFLVKVAVVLGAAFLPAAWLP